MATRKPRRFNEGDLVEAADKAAGLKASSGEKVGLFERLRMGNIDDPNSEAYRRFGAGRAKADRDMASEAAAQRVVDSSRAAPKAKAAESPVTPISKDFMSEKEPGWDTKAGSKPSASKPSASKPSASKPNANTSRTLTKPSAASSSTYRVDSAPGKLAQQEQTYTRKMGATAEELAKPYTRKMGATAEEIAKPYTRKMGATAEGVASAEPPVSSRYPETRGSAQEALRSGSAAYKRYVESRATPSKNLLGEKSYRDRSDGGDAAYKKGGSVKGWGMARGARKAKIV